MNTTNYTFVEGVLKFFSGNGLAFICYFLKILEAHKTFKQNIKIILVILKTIKIQINKS